MGILYNLPILAPKSCRDRQRPKENPEGSTDTDGFDRFYGPSRWRPEGAWRGLIVDVARRIFRSGDFAAWGLMLDSEGGEANKKLWNWYIAQGFTPAKDAHRPSAMYAALKKFLPELQPA